MRKTLKGVLIGVIIGVIICGITGLAANSTILYDVVTGGIKIVVDGQRVVPKDANGNTVEPFIYNGTTYLPVRAVATALGKEVYWDGPNYTVYLGKMNGTLQYPSAYLTDLTSINEKHWNAYTSQLVDNYGNSYTNAINNIYGHSKFEYLLNMKYSRFRGTLYIPQGEKYDDEITLKIIADGKVIYTSPKMTKTSAPVPIDVNITGCNNLKIEFSKGASTYASSLWVCLADAGFYQ